MSLRVYINDEAKELSAPVSLSELIAELELPAERIAVELNRAVIRRSDWSSTIVGDNDRLEIVHFVGGGASVTLCDSVPLRAPSVTLW